MVFFVVSRLPGEQTWQGYAGDGAYAAILGGMSTGGIVAGSLAGYWGGEFTNSFVLARMKVLTRGPLAVDADDRKHASRGVGGYERVRGGGVSFGVFPWSLFATLVLTNYLFKVAVEACMTPLTYAAVNRLKTAEARGLLRPRHQLQPVHRMNEPAQQSGFSPGRACNRSSAPGAIAPSLPSPR